MQTFSLRHHIAVRLNGRQLILSSRLMDHRLVFKDEFGEPLVVTEKDFYTIYDKKELCIDPDQPHFGSIQLTTNAPADLTCFPPSHAAEAVRRRGYLSQLFRPDETGLPSDAELSVKIKEISALIGDTKRSPSTSTVRRWARLYDKTKCIVRLVPQHRQKGRKSIIKGELEELLQDTMNDQFLKPERPSVQGLHIELGKRVIEANAARLPNQKLRLPSEMTVRRYIAGLNPFDIDCDRLGKYAANRKHRNAIGQLQVDMILDRWEIDHTPMDILLVDPETGEVIGRPYITVVLDRSSRMVMSFLIHLAAPNTESVLRVIERAIRPKMAWLEGFPRVLNEWRARGLPLRIVPDNAAEFHADDLIMAFNELGIEILYPKSRGPEMKGAVERFFRTMNTGLIHQLPGTTFSNPKERGDYPSEKMASLTLPEVESLVTKWVVDVYHQRPHKGLNGRTPANAWKDGENHRSPTLPTDLDALESILARRTKPILHHYGVEVDCQFYHSDELAELRLRLPEKTAVDVRYRDEMGHVWVRDPIRNIFIRVPIKDQRLVGLSRDLYRAALKIVKQKNANVVDFEAVHGAYRQIMAEGNEAKKSNKLRQRRYSAQTRIDKEGRVRPPLPTDETPVTAHARPVFKLDTDVPTLAIRPRAF